MQTAFGHVDLSRLTEEALLPFEPVLYEQQRFLQTKNYAESSACGIVGKINSTTPDR